MSDTSRISRLIAAIEEREGEPVNWRNAPEEWVNLARELQLELAEQVLCNGKGAEREADLLGKVERLERENARLREAAMGYLPLTHGEASANTYVKVKAYSLGALLRLCNSEPSA